MIGQSNLQLVISAKNTTKKAFQSLEGQMKSIREKIFNLRNLFIVGFATAGIKESIDASNELKNALIGLNSVSNAFNQDADKAKQAAIELASDGLMSVKSAADSLKNLLATGFSLPQAIDLMHGFKDAAAFNRQGTLEFGQAIEGATQGIKNQNSILVDNAGITKNLSLILKEAGYSVQDLGKVTSDTKVRTALYNGILKEASIFQGDAARSADTLSGKQAALKTQIFTVKAAIGDALAPTVVDLIKNIEIWIEKTGGADGIGKKVKNLIKDIDAWYETLKPLLIILGGGMGLSYTISLLTKLTKGYSGVLKIFTTKIYATTAKAKGLRVAMLALRMNIVMTVALAGFALVMSQIKSLKKAVNAQVDSETDLMNMRDKNFAKYKSLLKSENADVRKYAKLSLEHFRKLHLNQEAGAEFDLTASRQKINNLRKQIKEGGRLIEFEKALNKEKNIGANIPLPPEIPPPPPEVGAGIKAINTELKDLANAFDKYKDNIVDFGDKARNALKDISKTIIEAKNELNNLLVGNATGELDWRKKVAKAYVDQEKKVTDLEKELANETDQEKKDLLSIELEREKKALGDKEHLEDAFKNEIDAARKRASLTDFERKIEDLNKSFMIMNEEFQAKKKQIEDTILEEKKKYNKIREIQGWAKNNLIKFEAQQEKITVESINRQIEYYNKLAKAIAAARAGETSGFVSLEAGVEKRANQKISNVNVNINNPIIKDDDNLEQMENQVEHVLRGVILNNNIEI